MATIMALRTSGQSPIYQGTDSDLISIYSCPYNNQKFIKKSSTYDLSIAWLILWLEREQY